LILEQSATELVVTVEVLDEDDQVRMARGIQELPKVSPGPAMPDPSMQGGRPAAIFYPLGYPTPYGLEVEDHPLWSQLSSFKDETERINLESIVILGSADAL
jgi:hypothetical protein